MRFYKHALAFASGCVLLFAVLSCGCRNNSLDSGSGKLVERLGEITEGKPGSFGVAVITDDADTIVFINSSCYPMMSMFKLHEAIAVCHVLDERRQELDSALTVRRSDLDGH
ncbi:MAG: CfxA family class A broad-spectrum beta-lactamase, partial [Bacteroidales bacterium]|nr:CfxA family class A broad-spectrum beta-lactamase [Bacteroidales bacterium]